VAPKLPTVADLVWLGDLKFAATLPRERLPDATSAPRIIIDSAGLEGPSPVEALGLALAGCLSIDLVHILHRGRHAFHAMRSRLVGARAPDDPHRLVAVSLHFVVEGNVPPDAVQRALQLSREKYCSVWHSLRPDISLDLTFDIVPGSESAGTPS
jgi:putative redox protein